MALNLVGNQYLNVLTGLILLAEAAGVKCMDSMQLREEGRGFLSSLLPENSENLLL